MHQSFRLLVAAHDTMIGPAFVRACRDRPGVTLCEVAAPRPDFESRSDVAKLFAASRPDWVVVAAGASGGIGRNQREPATLMRNNLLALVHCLEAAREAGAARLLYLASSCVYPREAAQPMQANQLMTGPLEPTSEAFATARLAGLALCRAYRRQHGLRFVGAIPSDVYGPGDSFSTEDSHVVSGMIRRMHEARQSGAEVFEVWGSGNQRRDFLYVDDLAEACLVALDAYDGDQPINLGGGQDVAIRDLAEAVRDVVGYRGVLRFDSSRPDGAPRKTLDASVIFGLGFRPHVTLREGLTGTYRWYTESTSEAH